VDYISGNKIRIGSIKVPIDIYQNVYKASNLTDEGDRQSEKKIKK
jgi:hypothetical protein